MTATIVSSVAHRRRLERASAWLEGRGQSEELLVVGATLDGANELARVIATGKGVTFGWHRLGISQLAFAIASSGLAQRGLAPLSRVGTQAIVARIVHQMRAGGRLTSMRPLQRRLDFHGPSPELSRNCERHAYVRMR